MSTLNVRNDKVNEFNSRLTTINNIIDNIATYLKTNFEKEEKIRIVNYNRYNNIIKMRTELEELKTTLLQDQEEFINNNINFFTDKYPNMETLFQQIENEINAFYTSNDLPIGSITDNDSSSVISYKLNSTDSSIYLKSHPGVSDTIMGNYIFYARIRRY